MADRARHGLGQVVQNKPAYIPVGVDADGEKHLIRNSLRLGVRPRWRELADNKPTTACTAVVEQTL